jgi:hypothetical protein
LYSLCAFLLCVARRATKLRRWPENLLNDALTLGGFLANTSAHEKLDRTYRGGTAHGQDGVTIRR